ncbi:carboxypeptidase-like regulatory domain-containing protein [Hymenobacter negativus]|uniref:Carboxypeptidase-like regulatory domain-containing protein n=1 Tax=Hymenobacter negativus TaxID=2795026 RepID=A0ABS3QPW2_9BACT|nr:carboxypeptidase-like regulatory domain-containing protein [Hymenobacter negativus]MBO2012804.1 carboxypeptidase-like regulatory domain-containing protein [Hymenobacter negativus]
MKSENLPKVEAEQYDPNLDAQDEDVLSGGNNRLTYILVGLILALVIGYVALPKGQGSGLASVTPTFMLDDAAVTATVPTAADSMAAGLKGAPAATDADDEPDSKSTKRMSVAKASGQATASAAAPSAEAGAAAPVATVAAEPVAAAPAPAAAPEPAAPANTTLTGKIEDENGHPLVGATVLLKGSSKGTSTDANGNYSLEVPAGGDNTLIYGYGGYDDEVQRARGNQPLNVTLTPRAKTSKRRR